MAIENKTANAFSLFAELMQTEGWTEIDYERTRLGHLKDDEREGYTCVYDMRKDPEIETIQALLGDEFAKDGHVNQHAVHSLRAAIVQAQKAFKEHVQRLEALRGTAQGRTIATHGPNCGF